MFSIIEHHKDIIQGLYYTIAIPGIVIGLYQYYKTKVKEQRDREYGTYNALDEKYLDYQNLCLQYPRLDVFDIRDDDPVELTPEEKKQELIAFTMLFSIFERAYLMYHEQHPQAKEKQWSGWEQYIKDYCTLKFPRCCGHLKRVG